MNIAGVYCIRNLINSHMYIGSSVHIYNRWGIHEKSLMNNHHHSAYLQSAYNKYGGDNFEFVVLIICHSDMLLWYEQQFIDRWKPEYNVCHRAGSWFGNRHSEETKKKMSESQKGHIVSKEQRKKISLAHMGYKYSEEAKKNMSVSHMGNHSTKGHRYSEESRRKMSKSQMGNKNALGNKGNKNAKGRRRKI